MQRKSLVLISTGGTMEKTYDARSGTLSNRVSVLDVMLGSLELRGIELERIRLMNLDSLEMSDEDHELISRVAGEAAATHDGVVIGHGTDRLATSGERIVARWGTPRAPIVLTGAMRPYELRDSDALQNLTEALMAAQLLPPGVYAVMHGQVLQFPGVLKDPARGSFIKPGP